jgi:hypothetical protein
MMSNESTFNHLTPMYGMRPPHFAFCPSHKDLCRAKVHTCSALFAEAPSDLQLSKAFESIEVIDLDGSRTKVTGLWQDRKVVVAWARHFG